MSIPQLILTLSFLFILATVVLVLFFRACKRTQAWFCCKQCGVYFNFDGETTVETPDKVDNMAILCDVCLHNAINQEKHETNNS